MSSSYENSRRSGVNFSHFLHDLNEVSPPQEPSPKTDREGAMEEDLAMFTNVQFFDWEQSKGKAQPDYSVPIKEPDTPVAAPSEGPAPAPGIGEFDFNISSDLFGFFLAHFPLFTTPHSSTSAQQVLGITPAF
ncbi:hypothetical protein BX600DRAFT_430905 [Xylariales sp. PMI_506]|nr:hypothetical protein BX600DRAFT_430905 [Xylariales sp. PMI_506]